MITELVRSFQDQHGTALVPTSEDFTGASALQAITPLLDGTGIGISLAHATVEDLGVFLKAASFLENLSGWVRCDVVGHLLHMTGCNSVSHLRETHRQAYNELLSLSGASLGTLQNDWTTFQCWPKPLRRPEAVYSVHMALNAIRETERLTWLLQSIEEGWSVGRTRAKVAEYLNEPQPEDEERWLRLDRHLLQWGESLGASITRTNNSIEMHKDGNVLKFVAVVLPSGQAAIRIE